MGKRLYSICQRYNFESNLQLDNESYIVDMSCIRYVKDTILKAIYNYRRNHHKTTFAVFDMSKIQFWKQFTTIFRVYNIITLLYSICQRYNFESNLQLAIVSLLNSYAVFDMSKIQFWKQFTTFGRCCCHFSQLYSICQRYNFESNLQPAFAFSAPSLCCIRYVKDTILKAIYNWSYG